MSARKPEFVVYRKPNGAFRSGRLGSRSGSAFIIEEDRVFPRFVIFKGSKAQAVALRVTLQAALDERTEVIRAAHDHYNATVAAVLRSTEEGAA